MTLDFIDPIGCIYEWLHPAPPLSDEWIFCEGQPLSDFPELQAVMGPAGWDTVPDLRKFGAYIIKAKKCAAAVQAANA